MTEGKDYCERKINLLKSNYEQLLDVSIRFVSLGGVNLYASFELFILVYLCTDLT